jgi:hypothetical protein
VDSKSIVTKFCGKSERSELIFHERYITNFHDLLPLPVERFGMVWHIYIYKGNTCSPVVNHTTNAMLIAVVPWR